MSFTRHKLFVKEFYLNSSVTFNKLVFKSKRHNDQKKYRVSSFTDQINNHGLAVRRKVNVSPGLKTSIN